MSAQTSPPRLRDPIALLFVLSVAGGLLLLVAGDTAERVVGLLVVVNGTVWLLDQRHRQD